MLSKNNSSKTNEAFSKYNTGNKLVMLSLVAMACSAELLSVKTVQADTPNLANTPTKSNRAVPASNATSVKAIQPADPDRSKSSSTTRSTIAENSKSIPVPPTKPTTTSSQPAKTVSNSLPTISIVSPQESSTIAKSVASNHRPSIVTTTGSTAVKASKTSSPANSVVNKTKAASPSIARNPSRIAPSSSNPKPQLEYPKEPLNINYYGIQGVWDLPHERLTLTGGKVSKNNIFMNDSTDSRPLLPYLINKLHEIQTINITGKITLADFDHGSNEYLFSNFPNATSITGLKNVSIINGYSYYPVHTSLKGLFANDSKLTALDLSSWNGGTVFDTSSMFAGDRSLRVLKLNYPSFDHVINSDQMFYQVGADLDSSSASEIEVSANPTSGDSVGAESFMSWNSMFEQSKLKTVRLDLTVVSPNKVRDLFKQAQIGTIIANGFVWGSDSSIENGFGQGLDPNIENGFVRDSDLSIADSFQNVKVENLHLNNWEIHDGKALDHHFLSQINVKHLFLPGWHISFSKKNAQKIHGLLTDIAQTNASVIDLHNWGIVAGFSLDRLFANIHAQSINLNGWLTSNITTANDMFEDASINQLSMNDWNFNGMNLMNMFENAHINQLSIVRPNMTNTLVADMFHNGVFNQANLDSWFFTPEDNFDNEINAENELPTVIGSVDGQPNIPRLQRQNQIQSSKLDNLFADSTFNGSLNLNSWRMSPVTSLMGCKPS